MGAIEFVIVGEAAFAKTVGALVEATLGGDILASRVWTREKLGKARLNDGFVEDREQLVRDLCGARLAAIDLSMGAEAHYALGVREALTSGITLACFESDTQTGAQKADEWALKLLTPTFVNVRTATAASLAKTLEPLIKSSARAWTNEIRAARAANVSEAPLLLNSDGAFGKDTKPAEGLPTKATVWTHDKAIQPKQGEPRRKRPVVGMRFGDIAKVKDVGAWVNSENVNMQMAREVEKSISARIRYLGTRRTGPSSENIEDAIYMDLSRAMGSRRRLEVGDVLMTRAPARTPLLRDNNVHIVAHVATVESAGPAAGFRAAGDIGECMRNTLERIYDFAKEQELTEKVKKVMFPLLAAGDGGLPAPLAASQMVDGLLEWLKADGEAQRHFDAIYFSVRDARTRDAVRQALKSYGFDEHTPVDQ